MATFTGVPSGFYLKGRPKAYKAKDAAYTTGGNKGMVLSRYPKKYPKTPQQIGLSAAAKTCGIKKGMNKADLQKAMVCVGDATRNKKFT